MSPTLPACRAEVPASAISPAEWEGPGLDRHDRPPIRVLELRAVRGQGGGPDKTIFVGAAQADPRRLAITLCVLRRPHQEPFWMESRAAALGLDYVELVDRWALDTATFTALHKLVRSRGIDIVHSHDYKTDLLAYLLARVAPVVPLATAHGWTGSTWRERLLYYPADRLLLARFPQVVAVAAGIRDTLLRGGADRRCVEVVLNGVEATPGGREHRVEVRRQWGFGDEELVVGGVGRLERQKRFDLLLAAFATLRERRPELRLVIAGEGELVAALRRLAVERGVAADCRFLGHRSDVDHLHHGFDVFVQSSDYEGSANALLEAMLGGTPIVATAVGGSGELLAHGIHGLLVPRGDLAELVAAIDTVLAHPGGAQARASAARGRALDELSFARRQLRLLEIYERVVAAAGRRPSRRSAGDRD
ncbi:MAG TPA: glycosyltransferase [Thermoanaerobaculia bacterium]|jgi:glycosyltransferase involved in cell wall biosynthesis|nr:glycosyltransferase [Thermoanaerobaculia bacterium]